MIEQTAEAQSRVARESIRRKAGENQRAQGQQRAAIAASGIVESAGTPIDILAETAAQVQMDREDSLYADELNRRSLFRDADMERLGGRITLAGGALERSTTLAEVALRSAAGRAEYLRGLHEAEITRLTGAAQKQGYYGQAQGTLLSGIGSAVGGLGSFYLSARTSSAAAASKKVTPTR